MREHAEFMLLLYAQQMKGRKLSVGEALKLIDRAVCKLNTINSQRK